MFNTQNVVYATYLANLQRNSYTKAIVKARGELNWSKDYTDFHEPPFQQPRSVLINNGKIGIEQGNDLLVYTIDGTFLYALTSPAFFGEKAIASVKNFLLNYFDYDKNVLTESIDIRGYEEFTALLLLRPLWDEIISATQYSGGPHREPPSFCVSRQPIDKFSATWLYEGEGAIKHAFLGNDEKTTIIIEGIKIITIDNASGSRSENTPIDYNLISTACLNLDNKLILTGLISNLPWLSFHQKSGGCMDKPYS